MFFRELTGRLWDWFGSGSIVGVGCVQTVFPGFLLTFSGLGWIIYLLMGLGWVGLLWLPIWKCSPGKRKWVFVWFSVLGWSLWLVMFFFLENVLPGNKLGSFEIIWVWLLWLVVRFCFMENVFPRNKGIVCEMFWFEFDNRGWRWRAYIYSNFCIYFSLSSMEMFSGEQNVLWYCMGWVLIVVVIGFVVSDMQFGWWRENSEEAEIVQSPHDSRRNHSVWCMPKDGSSESGCCFVDRFKCSALWNCYRQGL